MGTTKSEFSFSKQMYKKVKSAYTRKLYTYLNIIYSSPFAQSLILMAWLSLLVYSFYVIMLFQHFWQ